jgi:hypothetical protein
MRETLVGDENFVLQTDATEEHQSIGKRSPRRNTILFHLRELTHPPGDRVLSRRLITGASRLVVGYGIFYGSDLYSILKILLVL